MKPRLCPHCGKIVGRTSRRSMPSAEHIEVITRALRGGAKSREELVTETGLLGQTLRTDVVWLIEMGRVRELDLTIRGASGRKHKLLELAS